MLTAPGRWARLLDDVPGDPAGVARVVQGLMIHEFWTGAYGVTLTEPERDRVNLRRVADVLAAIRDADGRPLTTAREPGARIATNCRGFTVMAVAMLRHHGVAARARCGFGTYFTPGFFEDHWVVEYAGGGRWKLLDAQIDEVQRAALDIDFDLTDVSRDRFVIAGEAWRLVRDGAADPSRFGLSSIGEAGEWWIAANLMRDAAALTGVELLPWDVWGAMPEPGEDVDRGLFDELAAATREPDLAEVERLMADGRLRVPDKVYNVQHRRLEQI